MTIPARTAGSAPRPIGESGVIAYDKVRVEYGDSDLPPGPMAGNSNQTATVATSVLARRPRPFVVAFVNPMHHRALDDSPALTRRARTARWFCYAAA